jgi:hypothetical protein
LLQEQQNLTNEDYYRIQWYLTIYFMSPIQTSPKKKWASQDKLIRD